jgi:hypothetical protein
MTKAQSVLPAVVNGISRIDGAEDLPPSRRKGMDSIYPLGLMNYSTVENRCQTPMFEFRETRSISADIEEYKAMILKACR